MKLESKINQLRKENGCPSFEHYKYLIYHSCFKNICQKYRDKSLQKRLVFL